jgi:hypothetical protein
MGQEWKFEQLGGQRRILTLAGASAPHGRERRDPIVKDGVKLRKQRQFYSGNDIPTTHIFGVHHSDWELKGRFQDSYLGKGGTKEAISNWLAFVSAGQPVRVSWGDVMSVEGILDSFTPGRESERHSTYELVLLVDKRDEFKLSKVTPPPPPKTELCAAIREFIKGEKGIADKVKEGGSLASLTDGISEGLANAVGSLNQFSAAVVNIAQGIDDFTSGTIGQFERLKAGAQQIKTACIKMQNILDEITADDSATEYLDADARIQQDVMRAGLEADLLEVLALLADLDRAIDIEQSSRPSTVYVAISGDTWESIASALLGGPDRAGDIRDANGVRYGELPVAGRSYQIPA